MEDYDPGFHTSVSRPLEVASIMRENDTLFSLRWVLSRADQDWRYEAIQKERIRRLNLDE